MRSKSLWLILALILGPYCAWAGNDDNFSPVRKIAGQHFDIYYDQGVDLKGLLKQLNVSHADEILFRKIRVFAFKKVQRLPQTCQQTLIPTVLRQQIGIGLREFLGTHLQNMLNEFPVIVTLEIGRLYLGKKLLKILGGNVTQAEVATNLFLEQRVLDHASRSEMLVIVMV